MKREPTNEFDCIEMVLVLSVYLGIHSNYIVKSGGVNSAGAGHAADHF